MFFLCITVVTFIVGYLYWYLKRHFSVFERLGIPGPKPHFLLGNLPTIQKKGQLEANIEWEKQYGRVFGYFEGYEPVLEVSDPDLLREILVKDSENFLSRKPFPLAPKKSLGLFLENGHQWKRSRTILTPAFSTGKLKQMFHIMHESVDLLVDNVDRKAKQKEIFDSYDLFQCLTLDVIGRCAFGLQTNAQRDETDSFLVNIRSLFGRLSKTFILPIVMLFPFLQHVIFALKNIVFLFGMNPVVWLRNQLREVIKIRREMGGNRGTFDLVQQMLFNGDHSMSEREIVAQSLTFLLAGYETTSTVLAFLSNLLALNPTVQDRLCREIDDIVGDDDVSYDVIKDLHYFDMVFDEVCRLYPTASLIVTRQAKETRTYGDITIPAGMNIQANVWALHHDAEFWDCPNEFMPERFSTENRQNIRPYSFLPFGAGPRNCIGSRFALLETKCAIVRILQKYKFQAVPETKKTLPLECRGAIVPRDGVPVRVLEREERDSHRG